MSFQQFRQRCKKCEAVWNAAFGVVGTTIIAQAPKECPKCKSPDIELVGYGWTSTSPAEDLIRELRDSVIDSVCAAGLHCDHEDCRDNRGLIERTKKYLESTQQSVVSSIQESSK